MYYDKDFTVCVLLHGDYPDYAARCLGSIARFMPHSVPIRIGMNACSEAVQHLVNPYLRDAEQVIASDVNLFKYPMMRRLFYQPGQEIKTKFIMWFDDDSFIKTDAGNWFRRVYEAVQQSEFVSWGAPYGCRQCRNQYLWVRDQPWYNGKPLTTKHRFTFPVGGWWITETAVLQRFNWPPPNIIHRGGDMMFGELLRQHDLKSQSFRDGVAINASLEGRESRAPRRGHGFDNKPAGWDYEPGVAEKLVQPLPKR